LHDVCEVLFCWSLDAEATCTPKRLSPPHADAYRLGALDKLRIHRNGAHLARQFA